MEKEKIRNLEVKKDDDGNIVHVGVVFGPHHFLDVRIDPDGKVKFSMGATHHGFEADATEIDSELYHVIEELRRNHRDKVKVIDDRFDDDYV